jgi:hypothetical protein
VGRGARVVRVFELLIEDSGSTWSSSPSSAGLFSSRKAAKRELNALADKEGIIFWHSIKERKVQN